MTDYVTTFNVKDALDNDLYSITFDPRDGIGSSSVVNSPFNYTYTSLDTFHPTIQVPGFVGKVEPVAITETGQTINITLYNMASAESLASLAGIVALNATVAKEATISELVWDAVVADHQHAGSTGEALNEARMHSLYDNLYVDQPVYSTNNILLSARVRIYSNATSVGTDDDVIATYTMTATELAGKVATYKTVKL